VAPKAKPSKFIHFRTRMHPERIMRVDRSIIINVNRFMIHLLSRR